MIISICALILALITVYFFWRVRQEEIKRNDEKGIPTAPLH